MSDQIYPIAEIFDSIQGEGSNTGVPMTFIRLAGCNVGRYPTTRDELLLLRGAGETPFALLPNQPDKGPERINSRYAICESFDGRAFMCDTDYHTSEKLTIEQILERVNCPAVSITGGEPFMHDLWPLVDELSDRMIAVQIETSGTKPIDPQVARGALIVCSPKRGFLHENRPYIGEWKFLVSDATDLEKIEKFIGDSITLVYIQPVNSLWHGDLREAARWAKWLIEEHSDWRLSVQLHKYLEMR